MNDDRRRFWRVLLLIALVALAVRVTYVFVEKREGALTGDELFYNAEANYLADGHLFTEPFNPRFGEKGQGLLGTGPAADHPPLTVSFLTPISFVSDRSELAQRLMMTVVGFGTVLAIGVLAFEIAGRRAGWIAAGIAAIYPNLFVNDGLVMSESLSALLVTLTLLFGYRLLHTPSLRLALGVGALCGLAALARAELLLLFPLLALPATLRATSLALRERWKLVGAGAAATALVLLPWVAFNLSRFDEPTFISTNDGTALVGSNCDDVYYGEGIGLWAFTCLGKGPLGDQSVDSEIYRDRAFDYIRDHTERVPAVVAARVGRTWSVFRPWDMVDYNVFEGREKWVTVSGLIFYYPLVIAAIAGAVVLWRRKATLWPLLVPPVIVTLVSAATYGQTRFRVPAEPSLIVLAAIALAALWARVSAGRARSQPAPLPPPR